jgi:hypothetical protein
MRAQTELGVTFRPITDTLREEAQWFRQHHLISPQRRVARGPQDRTVVVPPR